MPKHRYLRYVPVVVMPSLTEMPPVYPPDLRGEPEPPLSLPVPSQWISYQVMEGDWTDYERASFTLQKISGGPDAYVEGTGWAGAAIKGEWSERFNTIYLRSPHAQLYGTLSADRSMILGYWQWPNDGLTGRRQPWIAIASNRWHRQERQLSGFSFPVPSKWRLYRMSVSTPPPEPVTGVVHFTGAEPAGMFKIGLTGTWQSNGTTTPISGQWSESSHSISFQNTNFNLSGAMVQTDGNLIGGRWGASGDAWVAQRIE